MKYCMLRRRRRKDFHIPNLGGDIDVWIEKTLTGIECKLRSSDSKPIGQQLKCYSDGILDDLKYYYKQ